MGKSRVPTTWIATMSLAALAAVVVHGCEAECGPSGCVGADRRYAVGRDLAAEDWGPDARVGVWAQGLADVDAATADLVADLTAACDAIAFEAGLAIGVGPLGEGPDRDRDRLETSCSAASVALRQLRAELALVIDVSAPRCTIAMVPQAACEARCAGDAGCVAPLGDFAARCPADALAGSCEGGCEGACEASDPSPCAGSCEGRCEGDCDGECFRGPEGACRGACEGTCEGTCVGTCTLPEGGGACRGTCLGACSSPLLDPRCAVELEPPSSSCGGGTDCALGCRASGAARVRCEAPRVSVTRAGEPSPASRTSMAMLERHLPLVLIVHGRALALEEVGMEMVLLPAAIREGAAEAALPILETQAETLERIEAVLEATSGLVGGL